MKRKPADKFINDQLSQWPLACENFRALRNVNIREVEVGGLKVHVQFNPARIRSSSADVSADAIKARKCFLCRDNRPKEQIYMKFEGRKSKKYDILVNPYPIFPGHLVIASDRHVNQAIWKRYVDMLDMSRAFSGYALFYNGPRCGASAPDHFHFQASLRGCMPLENDVDALLDACVSDNVPEGLVQLLSVQDASLYHYRKYLRGIFVLKSDTAKSAAKMFYRLLDCAPGISGGDEPMFNLISWYKSGEYRSVVIFRRAHRPHHYFDQEPDRLMISPGCADMAGVLIAARQEDFDRLGPEVVREVLEEVALDRTSESELLWRLTRKQPAVSVGIMSGKEIEFEIISDGAGPRFACFHDGKIEYDGALYDELFFEAPTPAMMFAEPSFILHGVTIGVDFHWERQETQKFAGALKIIVEKDRLVAVNVIGVEDYLLSVISSEMKSTSSLEFLKAHAVISRSWLMSLLERRHRRDVSGEFKDPDGKSVPEGIYNLPSLVTYLDVALQGAADAGRDRSGQDAWSENSTSLDRVIKWYGHQDHRAFDVCADDHCQRYQGLTRAAGDTVMAAVDATWGEVLSYGGKICDARFSKCCGGITERFSVCWEDVDYDYLQSIPDSDGGRDPFCSNPSREVIAQVLNDYDQETPDFYRWTEEYGIDEISSLISRKSGRNIGQLKSLKPLKKGGSERIYELLIEGSEDSFIVGKELEIRKMLSETHLKSSAFEAEFRDDRVILHGRGWGHGVGLCQIGAAVMASEGYGYREILAHYYRGAEVSGPDTDNNY